MKKLICFALLFVSVIATAQNENGLWKKSNSSKVTIKDEKSNFPQKNLFNLDFASLKKVLKNSPKRDITNKHSNTIITLPTIDGKMEKFEVYENSVLAPELAAKFPEIKSYIAVGVDNPSARAYLSSSPLGFKSMTLYSNHEAVFIEPINVDNSIYTVYKTSDRKQAFSKFECSVVDAVKDTQDLSINTLARGADDGKLTTLRLALACTGEYAALFGGTKALALAGMNNTITRVNGVYERDFGLKLILVANNDAVVYTSASTDPFSIMSNWKTESQTNFTSVIGEANYDIGHLFGTSTAPSGDAGCLGCVGVDYQKGRGFTCASSDYYMGDGFDIEFACHEIGHQLGANHTFSYKNEGSIAQMEPGSGTTVMSYAGVTSRDIQMHRDAYFYAISIQQVTDNIKSKNFISTISTGNAVPIVNAGLDFTIPKGTPFMLTGSATDANTNDILTYAWEQMDLGNATASTPIATATVGPIFRSYPPVTSSRRYFPNMNTILAGSTTTSGLYIPAEVLPGVARTLNFRLTVRDNRVGGGANNTDDVIVSVDGVAGPFTVDTQNTAVSYAAGTSQNINWTVAGTNANGVNCANVDILLSTDGGLTFPITLVAGTPNDGAQAVVIPNVTGATNRIMVKGSNHIFFDVNNANFTITGSGSADTTAPIATTISASGTTATGTNLSWNTSSDNVGVVGYKVYQNGVLKTTTASTSTSLVVSGLSASTAYGFYVTAYDAVGNNSAASNTVNVTTLTLVDTTAPATTIVAASGTTTSSTNLSWNVSSDNVGVVGYKVYQNGVLKTTTASTSLVVSGLSASTAYGFYVTAYDAVGNNSAASNTVNVTTLTLVDTTAPATTIVAASGTTTSSTNLSWNVSSDNVGVVGYKVYQNGVLKTTTASTSLVVSGLSASTAYGFYVTAYDAVGNNSVASNAVNVTTLATTALATIYCTSNGGSANEYIKKVQIGTINNLSGSNGGYGNFTSLSTNVALGSLVSISISAGWVSSSYAEAYNVWIDYNKNGSFESNELVYSKSKSKAATVSGSFTIPTSALTGTTRMRVSMKFNANPSACEVFTRGEVEDYSVNIVNGSTVKMSDDDTTLESDTEVKDKVILEKNKDVIEELSFKLYPNPVKDGVIYFSGLTNNSSYKIFNQMGQQLAQGTIENDMINVSSLARGIYFVQITNNSSVGVKRFIKE